MIEQKGHNKNLDIWNLGVLFFELLTGRPPFEGKGQQDLFQNILNFKVRWPKGFSGVAKDLVIKLLKSNPDSRIGLSEILEHPWFQAHQPSKPTISKILIPQKKLDPSGEIEKGKYAVISKPSLKNKIESDSKSKTKLMISSDQPDSVMTRMNKQVRELTDENNELKIQNKMLSKDLENAQKENAELKEAMSKSSLILEDHEETKLLKSKIQQLEAYKKEVLIDLEDRKKSMRQTETQLEMKGNELEMLANINHTAIEKAENYKIKLDKLEVENEELRTRVQKAERERDQIEMESKNKMEVLQYKLLNKFETDDKQDDTAFDQLLNLCKAELEEIFDKVKKKDDEDGDLLSSESLEGSWSQQSKKINQMKTEYEQEIYENLKKIDDLTTEVEEVKRTLHRKYKSDIDEKNKAIVNLRSFETKYQQEVEKNKSYEEQLKDLSDKNKALELDNNVLKQEKTLITDKKQNLTEKLQEYESKYPKVR